ncbi:MAG: hypothetical protein JHC95_01480 [Solirubrobacteraceae bacterium]|nr:hypothetical protein [Solirubrobacteraceae bacterium]
MSADEVAAYYRENTGAIRASLLFINVCGAMIVPFFVVIALQIKRMQLSSNALAYGYLMAVAANAGLLMVADLVWLVAAFRPDRDPAVIQMLNDIGWVCFTAPVGATIVQSIMLGIAILLDERPTPIFPRWAGWFNLGVAVLIAPSAFAVSTQDGVLAWDGALSFWLRYGAFLVYLLVMFALVQSAIRRPSDSPSTSLSPSTQEVLA